MWKFHHLSVTQISREIHLGYLEVLKTAVILPFYEFVDLVDFSLQKEETFMKNHNSDPLDVLK